MNNCLVSSIKEESRDQPWLDWAEFYADQVWRSMTQGFSDVEELKVRAQVMAAFSI